MNDKDDDQKVLDKLRYKALFDTLKIELKLKQSPIAIKFFYTEPELDFFKKRNEYQLTEQPMSFCKWELTALEKGTTIYSEKKDLNCETATCCFNWQEDNTQTSTSSERLSKSVFGIAAAPLADARFIADTVSFYCEEDQAKTLINAWMEAAGVEPWQPEQSKEQTACNYSVYTHNMSIASIGNICPQSEFATKDGLVNIVLPADHLKHTVDELQEGKLSLNKSSFNRPGDGFFRFTMG